MIASEVPRRNDYADAERDVFHLDLKERWQGRLRRIVP